MYCLCPVQTRDPPSGVIMGCILQQTLCDCPYGGMQFAALCVFLYRTCRVPTHNYSTFRLAASLLAASLLVASRSLVAFIPDADCFYFSTFPVRATITASRPSLSTSPFSLHHFQVGLTVREDRALIGYHRRRLWTWGVCRCGRDRGGDC